MFSYQNFLPLVGVTATPYIILPLKVQCPYQPPSHKHYFPVYVLSLIRVLHGRNKHFADFSYFPLNNHKKIFIPFFIMTNHISFTTGFFHFIERPQFSSLGFHPALAGLNFGPFNTFMAVLIFFSKRAFNVLINSYVVLGILLFYFLLVIYYVDFLQSVVVSSVTRQKIKLL